MVLLGVGGYYVLEGKFASVTYEKEVKVETVEVEVETLQKRISASQEAAKGDIEAKAKAAYDEAVTQALLEIEIDVREAYQGELEKETAEKKKQSVSY